MTLVSVVLHWKRRKIKERRLFFYGKYFHPTY